MHAPAGWELILILVVIVLLFGTKKIPDLFKGVGQGLKEFKKAQKDAMDEPPAATPPKQEKTASDKTGETGKS